MKIPSGVMRRRLGERRGFVLPVAVFAILLMAVVGVAMISLSQDEWFASRAMRESALAFYAAEAGANQVRAGMDDSLFAGLEPFGTRDLGWRTLPGGARYRATIQRWDTSGVQNHFTLTVEGRSPLGARRLLSVALTAMPPSRYRLGQCCDAALTIRGTVGLDDGAIVSGLDRVPLGWEDACPEAGENKPGILMADTTQLTNDGAMVVGDPPLAEDRDLQDSSFDQFGTLSWDSIRVLANHVIDGNPEKKLDGVNGPRIGPSYNVDGTCNRSDPYNWGSNDPSDPCFGYFPIILIKGEVEVHNGYGQAVVLVDWDDSKPPGAKGGEFELETNFVFNGLILGKGCVEIQKRAVFQGAVFVDANYRNEDLCGGDSDYDMNDRKPKITWSQCAVDRAIVGTGLARYAESEGNPARPLPSRSFGELFF